MGFQVHKIPILLNTFSILLKNKKADFSAFEWLFLMFVSPRGQ